MTHALSIALQILGALLAAGALIAERRASVAASGSDGQPGSEADENPWEGRRLLGPRGNGTRVYPIDLQHGMRALQKDAANLEAMRRRAAAAWADQRRADREERAGTRKRVTVELLGVFLVTIGTALPDLAGAVCDWLR